MRILLKLSNVEEEFDLDDAENLLFHETLFEGYEKDQYLSEMGKTEKSDIQLNEITEIKTHSLNILRALYRHCQLGELVKDYIAEGFITAFKCYDGKSWAVSFSKRFHFYHFLFNFQLHYSLFYRKEMLPRYYLVLSLSEFLVFKEQRTTLI